MRVVSLLRAELLLHRRSLRSKLVLAIYPLLTLLPWPLVGRIFGDMLLAGPATTLATVAMVQPFTALLLAAGLAGRGADRASREELLPLLAGSPFSNAAVAFARAAVLALLYLAATALPYLALGAAGIAGGEPFDLLALAGAWLLAAWPMALAMGWTWLALTLIGGSDLAALLLIWLGGLLFAQVASRLGDWQATFGWPFFEMPHLLPQLFALASRGGPTAETWWITSQLVASEGPYDLRLAAERAAVDLGPALALALFLLAVASLRLGRCPSDMKPRSFAWAPSLGRLRQALARDGGLGYQRFLPWLLLVPALFSLYLVQLRADSFFAWGEERFIAETQDLGSPTDPALVLLSLEANADLGRSPFLPDGRLESRFVEIFENRGPAPIGRLSCQLNSRLEIVRLAATSAGAPLRLTPRRRHDRLWLELEPPVPPGARLELSGELKGRPASPYFLMRAGIPADNFGESWPVIQRDREERRRTRLEATDLHPAVSRNQVRLEAQDLLPLPRYTPWQGGFAAAQQATTTERAQSDSTPAESSLALARIGLELAAPATWRLFSACGDASMPEGGRAVLRSGCEMPPADFAVRGGLLAVEERGEVVLATTPAHAEAALPLLDALEEIHRQSGKAWPGAPPLGKVVLIEGLKYFEPNSPHLGFAENRNYLHSRGSLLEIEERQLIMLKDFDPLELAGPLLVGRLLRNRPLLRQDEWAIATLLREVVTRRLGLRSRTSVLGGPPWMRGSYARPIAMYSNFETQRGGQRLAALVADLEGRTGGNAIQLGIQDFLAGGPEPGSLAELVKAIEQRGEVSLERFAADFFADGALPELELAEVEVELRGGGASLVRGQLRNKGKGEVICPIVLRTDRGEIWQKVRVGGETATAFVFETGQKPSLVELDPAGTCLRFVPGGMPARDRVSL
jgi:hypothetical protein